MCWLMERSSAKCKSRVVQWYWMVLSNKIESTIEVWFYHSVDQWYWMVFSNTINITTDVWFIVEQYFQIDW